MSATNSKLIEEARSKLLEARLALISTQELADWADSRIAEILEPPYFLVAISLGEEHQITQIERLDLVRDPPTDTDCRLLAQSIIRQLEFGQLELSDLEGPAYECAGWLDSKNELNQTLHWISDELYLCREGIKDPVSSYKHIRAVLVDIASGG